MQQKIQFIATLLHEPELIIMDEPFSGLDPVNAMLLQDTLMELKKAGQRHPVLNPPHGPGGEAVRCDLPGRSWRGGAFGRMREVKSRYERNRVIIEFEGDDGFLSIRRSPNTRTMQGMRRSS